MSVDNKQLISSTYQSKALTGAKSGENHPFSDKTRKKDSPFFIANAG
jgi:hypothetical protein